MRHLNVEVTRRCNQRCGYCFNESGPHVRTPERSVGDWLQTFRSLQSVGLQSVHITGGEPFVWDGTIALLRGAAALGLGTSVLSNGYNVPTLLEKHPDVFRRLTVAQISLDSLDEAVNDRRRGHRGATHDAINAIDALRGADVPVEVSCVVSDETDLTALAAFCRAYGARLIPRTLVALGRASACERSAMDSLSAAYDDLVTTDRYDYVPRPGANTSNDIATISPAGEYRQAAAGY